MLKERFKRARAEIIGEAVSTEGVGGLNERSIHKILKLSIEPNTDFHEVKFLGSVADIKNEEGIFEVQTKGAYKLKGKLIKYLEHCPVTLVIPIIREKYLRYIDTETGEILPPKRSPRPENIYHALNSIFSLADLFLFDNFKLMLVFLSADEYKHRVKKKGQRRVDAIPREILEVREITAREEFLEFFPKSLPEEFVASEFSRAIKKPSRFTYFVIKFYENLGFIENVGKRGRAILYKRVDCAKIQKDK